MAHNDARFFSLPEGETILQLVSLVTLPLSLRVLPPFFRFTESIALANIVEQRNDRDAFFSHRLVIGISSQTSIGLQHRFINAQCSFQDIDGMLT